ncbi:hypothetical protein J8F10_21305 [Gemmata sp. G18]|uniref:Uncharacterized protein n=1 Tax=Gemmata palustris TaxID=2822762 RepID=A0ABS5BVR2_9BACT|nr:hypothetical protein [Gemmata palustris]MBP3957798.1 hypothetical protein [Gemmata palustris]
MNWSLRDWATLLLLFGQVLLPAITVAMNCAVDTPNKRGRDRLRGENFSRAVLNGLLIAHLCLAVALVVATRRRFLAAIVGSFLVGLSAVVNFLTWLAVIGVDF